MKTFIMLEIFSQDHFLASGDWDVYAPFPRKNVKICPNIFIIKLKVFSMEECIEYIHRLTHTRALYITDHRYHFYNAHYNYTHY